METTFDMFVETVVPENELIISRTDLKGNITYVNETFAEISGYAPEELIGQPHNIVRHPDMPKSAYEDLWRSLKEDQVWEGYVKNMRKDKGYYWVFAHISGVYQDGELVEYKSVREPVDPDTKLQMQNKYDQMRKEEENSCRVVIYTTCDKAEEIEKMVD